MVTAQIENCTVPHDNCIDQKTEITTTITITEENVIKEQ
jgi:hypothetical protein